MVELDTANNLISKKKELLANSLANCYYFQRFGGNQWSADQAKERIYHDGIDHCNKVDPYGISDLSHLRPFAHIWADEEQMVRLYKQAGAGTNPSYGSFGTMFLRIEDNVDPLLRNKLAMAQRRFENDAINIALTLPSDVALGRKGLLNLSGTAGYLEIIDLSMAVIRTPPDEIHIYGDAFAIIYELVWGVPQ